MSLPHLRRRALAAGLGLCAIALTWNALGIFASGGSAQAHRTRSVQGTVTTAPLLGPALLPGGAGRSSSGPALPVASPAPPNIVFVLTDDLSMNLLRFMPHVRQMQRFGLSFSNYFVSDSLCCPSRSSILTGNFPHDTHVFNNVGAGGGFDVFYRRGEQRRTFALALQRRGYLTAMMGKYLNGYLQRRGGVRHLRASYVPPGWSEWDVAGWGYPEFDYTMNEDGRLVSYGSSPADYLTDVLAGKGEQFIASAAAARRPFFLELAPFAPHAPYVPAPADAAKFPDLRLPRGPNFNLLPSDPPLWLRDHAPLSSGEIAENERVYRLRARDVQSVDRMIAGLELALVHAGVASNTYLFFSSDNGLHTGEYRLMPGKMTAFDTDIHVPLVVIGPGVPWGARSSAMTENIDLAETFAELAGTSLHADGRSLVQLLQGQSAPAWRDAILVEHHGPDLRGIDPDFQQPSSGSPRTYEAMRTPSLLYVEYDDGERELYDLRNDPFELRNLALRVGRRRLLRLHLALMGMAHCHGTAACWTAMHVSGR